MSVSKTILIGRVGQQPEIKNLENGNKLATFSLATSEKYKDKEGNKQEKTDWHNIVIFGKVAEIVEMFVNKGDLIYLEGQNKTRSWDDKEGNKRYTTEVVLSGFNGVLKMLGGKSEVQQQQPEPKQTENNTNESEPEDDLPF